MYTNTIQLHAWLLYMYMQHCTQQTSKSGVGRSLLSFRYVQLWPSSWHRSQSSPRCGSGSLSSFGSLRGSSSSSSCGRTFLEQFSHCCHFPFQAFPLVHTFPHWVQWKVPKNRWQSFSACHPSTCDTWSEKNESNQLLIHKSIINT